MSARPGTALRMVFRAPRLLYRWRLGWLLGHRFVLLDHVGRRSGVQHHTVLEVLDYSSSGQVVVMSGWGGRSDWYRNLVAGGPAQITVGRETYPVDHRVLEESEAAGILAGYERRNRWTQPVLRRILSSLAGFSYDGNDASRRALVRQLPLVRLAPVSKR